jgi:hypothetical protein
MRPIDGRPTLGSRLGPQPAREGIPTRHLPSQGRVSELLGPRGLQRRGMPLALMSTKGKPNDHSGDQRRPRRGNGRLLKQEIGARATLVELPGLGPALPVEDADAVARAVLPHLPPA